VFVLGKRARLPAVKLDHQKVDIDGRAIDAVESMTAAYLCIAPAGAL